MNSEQYAYFKDLLPGDHSNSWAAFCFFLKTKEEQDEMLGLTFLLGLSPINVGNAKGISFPFFVIFRREDK